MWFKSGKRILVLGCSKAGTGKLAKQLALGANAEFMPTAVRFGAVPGQMPNHQVERVQNYKASANGLVVQAIVYPQHSADFLGSLVDFCRAFDHVIWVHRDPRDRLVSHLLFKWARAPKNKIRKGRIDEWRSSFQLFKERLERKQNAPASVPMLELMAQSELATSYAKALASEKKTYENIEQLLITLRQLNHFSELKIEAQFAKSVTPLMNTVGLEVVTEAVLEPFAGNDWRNWFTQQDIVTFNPIYRNYIGDIGYESAYNLFDEPKLSEAQSTEYVERLFRGANRRVSQQIKRIVDTH